MSDRPTEQPVSLPELDARHDDLLSQLDELDKRIQTVLKEQLPKKEAPLPLMATDGEPASPSFSHLSPPLPAG